MVTSLHFTSHTIGPQGMPQGVGAGRSASEDTCKVQRTPTHHSTSASQE